MNLLPDSFYWATAVLLGAVVIGYFSIQWARKWSKTDVSAGSGFTLHQLRELRKSGQISELEYNRASSLITKAHSAQFSSSAKSDPPTDTKSDRPH